MPVMLFAATLLLTPQAAPSAEDLADAKCILALTDLSEKVEGSDKAHVGSAMMFFMGKVVGRSGQVVLGQAMEDAAADLQADGETDLTSVAAQCGKEVEQVGESL